MKPDQEDNHRTNKQGNKAGAKKPL
jgi:hypothetical protein